MAKGKSLEQAKLQEIIETLDDIISSGYGWSGWHQKQLTKLLEPLTLKARHQVFDKYYGEELPEGVTETELKFMAKLCGVKKLTIDFSQLEDEEEDLFF